ncbi:hypothetical protein UFOVP597_26 [uncultured Caudovirales phage]|uniref:Uncharacterized protein n=1 Tax=uncultured Caudovirales phage TaxID=2100421 RepID=A0A6J5MYU8_9CAUD|nr:hypothetical protein UFOVP597_26 [uncultured Caudovirales phage]
MSKQKNRMEMLVNATNVSIQRIKSGNKDPFYEISNLIELSKEISEMNASDYFMSNEDLPEEKSKQYYYELSNLLQLMLGLFAIEMKEEANKIKKINDILK